MEEGVVVSLADDHHSVVLPPAVVDAARQAGQRILPLTCDWREDAGQGGGGAGPGPPQTELNSCR